MLTKIYKCFFIVFFIIPLISIIHIQISYAKGLSCPNASGQTNGGSSGQFGPFDYRDPSARGVPLHLVEDAHFDTDVATLTAGHSGTLTGDLSYTLRAFPNHHRALQSLADLALRDKKSELPGLSYTVSCFFIRAKNFAPTDGMVNAIYAYYLSQINQKELASNEADLAINKNSNIPRIYYMVGLAYYYMGEYKKAMEYSQLAKKHGSAASGLDSLLSNIKQ